MKILFVSPDLEEKGRGINFILKRLILSSKNAGHEVGILSGLPFGRKQDPAVEVKKYLDEGRNSFADIVPGGYRKQNILKSAAKLHLFRPKYVELNQKSSINDDSLENHLDFFVKAPFYYQFLARNMKYVNRVQTKKVVKLSSVDVVIVASPSVIKKSDVGKAKLAHFVHDVMPLELKELTPQDGAQDRFKEQFYSTIKESDFLLTNSEDTKSKILKVNKNAKVFVLYGTASSANIDASKSKILDKLGLKKDGFLLFAGTLEKRKNLVGLLEAFSQVSEKIKIPLVIVGGAGWGFEEIYDKFKSLDQKVRKQIRFTGYLSEKDKFKLYENGYAFIFPSYYEGIGLILFEAMQSKLPVVTSKEGALPEAGGDAVLYIEDPSKAGEIAEKILRIVEDTKLRTELIQKGSKQVSKFTPAIFESRFMAALKEMK